MLVIAALFKTGTGLGTDRAALCLIKSEFTPRKYGCFPILADTQTFRLRRVERFERLERSAPDQIPFMVSWSNHLNGLQY
jgi:hypothetical protein